MVAFPNFLGCLDDVVAARALADRTGARLVVCFDPIASGLLRTPGSLGADIVVGEGQSLGVALSFGGPYLGLFACRASDVRRLPGRLVGETVDAEGRRGYVTTLRARAGHPAGESLLERLHQPDPHGCHCSHPARLAGHVGTARSRPPICPGRSLRREALSRSTGSSRLRALPCCGNSPSVCPSRPRWRSSDWRRRATSPASRWGRVRGNRLRRHLARGNDRAPHPGRDRRGSRRVGKGGPMSSEPTPTTSEQTSHTATPPRRCPAAALSAPLMGHATEPTLFEMSVSGRKVELFPDDVAPAVERRGARPERAARRGAGPAGGGFRTRPRGSFHPALAPPVLSRPRGLPARLLHDEVQPEGVRRGGGRCRLRSRASGLAGFLHPGVARGSSSTSRSSSATSPAWSPPRSSPLRERPGS